THSAEPASRLILIYTLAIGAFYGTMPLVPLHLAERIGVTEKTIGYYVMYIGAMGVLVRALLLGSAVRRFGEARLARLGLVLLAMGLGVVAVARSNPMVILAFTLMPLGTAFTFP